MNQAEYKIILQPHISRSVERIFLFLRSRMDYRNGVVGLSHRVDTEVLEDMCDYLPKRGSKNPKFEADRDHVRKAIDELLALGLIMRVTSGGKVLPLTFYFPLANHDLIRSYEEGARRAQHVSANQGTMPIEFLRDLSKSYKEYLNQQSANDSARKNANLLEQGAISVDPIYNTHSNAREGSGISVDNFEIDDLLVKQLKVAAINFDKEYLQTVLVKFQNQEKFFNQLKPIQHWRKLFVGYCASWKANQRGQHHANQDFSKHGTSQSNKQAVREAIYAGSQSKRIIDVN